MMKSGLLFVCLLTVLPAAVPGSFQQYDMECGGWLTGMIQHKESGRLYARTDVGGIYLSDDAGENWKFLSGEFKDAGAHFVQGIAVEQRNKEVVYQACGVSYAPTDPGRGIWKSSDGGKTWKHVLKEVNFSGNDAERHGGECLLIHPGNEDEVWAGSRKHGLWRSMNAGGDWERVGGRIFDGVAISGVTVHAKFPDQIWVCGTGGVWVSVNRGRTWAHVVKAEAVYRVVRREDGTTFVIGGKYSPAEVGDTKLWKFFANDWSNVSSYRWMDVWPNYVKAFQAEHGWKPKDAAACVTVLRDGRLIVAPQYRRLAVSEDDGASFTLLSTPATAGKLPKWQKVGSQSLEGGFNQLLQDSKNPERWYLTGGYGPARTDDGGKSWKYILKGMGEVVTWKVAFHGSDPDQIYFPIADHGLSVVTDGGKSGQSAGFIARHFPWPDDNLSFAHVAFGSESRIIAPGGEAMKHRARIYVSEDKGVTWEKRVPNGWPEAAGHTFVDGVVAKDDPDELLLLMGGKTGEGKGGLYRSTNAGLSFQQVPLPLTTEGKDAGNEFTWNAWVYRDGGGTDRRYFLMRWFGLFRSDDRGVSWAKVNPSGLEGPASWFDGIVATDDALAGKLWLGAVNGLWKSKDGGDNWMKAGDFERVDRLDALQGKVVVAGRRSGDKWDKIYYSADDGASWDEITRKGYRFPTVLAVAMDPDREGVIWISTNGRSVARFAIGEKL